MEPTGRAGGHRRLFGVAVAGRHGGRAAPLRHGAAARGSRLRAVVGRRVGRSRSREGGNGGGCGSRGLGAALGREPDRRALLWGRAALGPPSVPGGGSGVRAPRAPFLLPSGPGGRGAARSSGLPSISTAARTRGSRGCEHPGGTSGLPSPRPNRAPFLWAAAAASPGSRTDPDPPKPLPATQRESSIKTMDKFSFHIQKQPRPKENKKKTDPPPPKKKRIVRLNKMCSEHINQPTPVCAAQHSAQQNRDTGGGNGQHSKKTNENPQRNQCVS